MFKRIWPLNSQISSNHNAPVPEILSQQKPNYQKKMPDIIFSQIFSRWLLTWISIPKYSHFILGKLTLIRTGILKQRLLLGLKSRTFFVRRQTLTESRTLRQTMAQIQDAEARKIRKQNFSDELEESDDSVS